MIWASNIKYLNDSTEYAYALGIFTDELQKRKKLDGISEPALRLYDRLSSSQNFIFTEPEKGSNAYLKTASRHIRLVNILPVYVCSFSAREDDLSQWRGYCPDSCGISIGFNTEYIRFASSKQDFTLVRCIYDKEKQIELVNSSIDELIRKLESMPSYSDPNDFANTWFEFIIQASLMASAMKDNAFAKEEEWRLVSAPFSNFMVNEKLIRYREGKSMLVPYLDFNLVEHNEFPKLKKIIIGPTPHRDLSRTSVQSFFRSSGIQEEDIEFTNSEVPYRSW